MAELVLLLQELGFSEYEARAYMSLLQQHPVTGYALAKASGIPRPNIYPVLQKLEARGAVISVEVEDGNTYMPVPPSELTRLLANRYAGILENAQQLLEQIAAPADGYFVQNIQGYPQLVDHARDLIRRASRQLVIALWQPYAQLLASDVENTYSRGVAFTTLCLQACAQECGGCQGNIYRYHITSNRAAQWLIVIRDDAEMVIGVAEQQTQAVAFRTQNPALIELTSWYIRHSISLAAILSDMGQELEQKLQPGTQALLSSIGDGNSWLQQLLHLLKNNQAA
jgi:sugar-specific transcriptional regulator TrmB